MTLSRDYSSSMNQMFEPASSMKEYIEDMTRGQRRKSSAQTFGSVQAFRHPNCSQNKLTNHPKPVFMQRLQVLLSALTQEHELSLRWSQIRGNIWVRSC